MIEANSEFWKEVRCSKCRKLLAYEYIFAGRLLIKCYNCNELNKITYKTPSKILNAIIQEDEKNYNPDKEVIIKRKVSISKMKEGDLNV
mgnify:FL=1